MSPQPMNRIDRMFSQNNGEVLSIYMTAGYPELNDTTAILKALQNQGADMVEIGIPFSDPLADGPVIQKSSQIALSNGMSLKLLFSQLQGIRESVTIPLVLMGYFNPILKFGIKPFLELCRETGIDGVIIPDLPPEEYEAEYKSMFDQYGIHHALLITPHTKEERIRVIAGLSGGFLYLVADSSTTGARLSVQGHQVEYFRRINEMKLTVPGLVGFGISNHDTFQVACEHSHGAIIGSAFISILSQEGLLEDKIGKFLGSVRNGPASDIRA
jgi:tryptophan synthase alpha chain